MLALAVGILTAFVAAALLLASRDGQRPLGPRADADKPQLMLLTSLPLVFPETFGLDGGSPALTSLRTRYRVVPIAVADAENLRQGKLLFMAHARAQPAEALVELDQWVRAGGGLLLLADPALEWPSARPLGDPLRPSPMFPDTGLLQHWGLRLDSPEERGPVNAFVGRRQVLTLSPGKLTGRCRVASDQVVARCHIGSGSVTVIADADFLDVLTLGEGAEANLDGLLSELDALERE
ncbi:MAG: hypothetical protein ACJ8EY_08900 [Sphingomicrobium sp.]